MATTFGQASERLLSGNELSWSASGSAREGSIRLEDAGQRRLFHYLLSSDPAVVAEGADALFDGLIATWKDEASDPAPAVMETDLDVSDGVWRLHRIETKNFGGLNTYGGATFVLGADGDNWCLEGINGSGKTCLASAIIWAFTGYRLREQDGLDADGGTRQPVYDSAGNTIGKWPPLVTYPKSADVLKDPASAEVKLVFSNASGDEAIASRSLVSPVNADTQISANVDTRLTQMPHLIEAGLLMPARLPHIGFGTKSATLYEAMKALTGLDHMADIAESCSSQQ